MPFKHQYMTYMWHICENMSFIMRNIEWLRLCQEGQLDIMLHFIGEKNVAFHRGYSHWNVFLGRHKIFSLDVFHCDISFWNYFIFIMLFLRFLRLVCVVFECRKVLGSAPVWHIRGSASLTFHPLPPRDNTVVRSVPFTHHRHFLFLFWKTSVGSVVVPSAVWLCSRLRAAPAAEQTRNHGAQQDVLESVAERTGEVPAPAPCLNSLCALWEHLPPSAGARCGFSFQACVKCQERCREFRNNSLEWPKSAGAKEEKNQKRPKERDQCPEETDQCPAVVRNALRVLFFVLFSLFLENVVRKNPLIASCVTPLEGAVTFL